MDKKEKPKAELQGSCKNGHPWRLETTYFHPGSTLKSCRVCRIERQKVMRAKEKRGWIKGSLYDLA